MDRNGKIAVFAMGCFISNLVYTAWQRKKEKEQLKEIIRNNKSIEEEMRKTDFFLEDIKKIQAEIEQELSKLD